MRSILARRCLRDTTIEAASTTWLVIHASALFTDPRYLTGIPNTLLLATIVTLFSIFIGEPLAYFAAPYDFPGKSALALLPLITLVIPVVISAQKWLMIVGNSGVVTRMLRSYDITMLSFHGWPGLIVSLTFTYYAYVYVSTLAAIRGFDAQLEEAAQSLGTSPVSSRLKVMVPVIMPAALTASPNALRCARTTSRRRLRRFLRSPRLGGPSLRKAARWRSSRPAMSARGSRRAGTVTFISRVCLEDRFGPGDDGGARRRWPVRGFRSGGRAPLRHPVPVSPGVSPICAVISAQIGDTFGAVRRRSPRRTSWYRTAAI